MDDKIKTFQNALPMITIDRDAKYQSPTPKKEIHKSKSG